MANAGLAILLHVLTLNIWGLPDVGFHVLAPLRSERVTAICESLKDESRRENGWQIILLQEAWLAEDRKKLKACGYRYSVDLEDPSRLLDSGLLILSRYPIGKSARLIFSAPPTADFQDGESFARKGAIIASVQHPAGPIWIANTHLISQYSQTHDTYFETRKRQFLSFYKWATDTVGNEPLILGGDFNFGPGNELWTILEETLLGFSEAAESKLNCTICPPNTMHKENEGKVDHLFASSPFKAVAGSQAFTSPVPISDFSIHVSDHFGWQTTFEVVPQ